MHSVYQFSSTYPAININVNDAPGLHFILGKCCKVTLWIAVDFCFVWLSLHLQLCSSIFTPK